MNKLIFYLVLLVFYLTAADATLAQPWKPASTRAIKKAAQAAKQTAVSAGAKPALVSAVQIQEALSRAQTLWEGRSANSSADRQILQAWATEQNIPISSSAYQEAFKNLAFIRQQAAQAYATRTHQLLHINSVNYAALVKNKNEIFIAAEWNTGAQFQIEKLLQAVRQQNPGTPILLASPFLPPTARSYSSGEYSLFLQANGNNSFIKQLLAIPRVKLIPLEQQGVSVFSHWKNWIKTLQPFYNMTRFGKSKKILIILAPAKFIEGNLPLFNQLAHFNSPWNKNQTLTVSIRTGEPPNITDYKWKIIMQKGVLEKSFYNKNWQLNAWLDQPAAPFSRALGTDLIIRVPPQAPALKGK